MVVVRETSTTPEMDRNVPFLRSSSTYLKLHGSALITTRFHIWTRPTCCINRDSNFDLKDVLSSSQWIFGASQILVAKRRPVKDQSALLRYQAEVTCRIFPQPPTALHCSLNAVRRCSAHDGNGSRLSKGPQTKTFGCPCTKESLQGPLISRESQKCHCLKLTVSHVIWVCLSRGMRRLRDWCQFVFQQKGQCQSCPSLVQGMLLQSHAN